jgi:hypothetical protein
VLLKLASVQVRLAAVDLPAALMYVLEVFFQRFDFDLLNVD